MARLNTAPLDDRTAAAATQRGWAGCICGSCKQDLSAFHFAIGKVERARFALLLDGMPSSTPQAVALRSRPTAETVSCEPPKKFLRVSKRFDAALRGRRFRFKRPWKHCGSRRGPSSAGFVSHPKLPRSLSSWSMSRSRNSPQHWRATLGAGLIDRQSQKMTAAARAMADRNTFGQRSYRVAMRRHSFRRPNRISTGLRRL